MDTKLENQKLRTFWNDYFKQLEPTRILEKDITISNKLDEILKELGDKAEHILDIGTGTGYCALTAKILGKKAKKIVAIDPSLNAINFLKETCKLSEIVGIEALVGDQEVLKKYQDESFDGIISSNVLDVLPEEVTEELIVQINRLLKPGGLLLLKFNFYLTEELIQKLNMIEIDKNTYTKDGIIRGVNHTTEEWLTQFPDYEVMEIGEYERIKNGPKDRIILLKK